PLPQGTPAAPGPQQPAAPVPQPTPLQSQPPQQPAAPSPQTSGTLAPLPQGAAAPAQPPVFSTSPTPAPLSPPILGLSNLPVTPSPPQVATAPAQPVPTPPISIGPGSAGLPTGNALANAPVQPPVNSNTSTATANQDAISPSTGTPALPSGTP